MLFLRYWKKLTILEKSLLLLLIITLMATAILAITFGSTLHKLHNEYVVRQETVCLKPECVRIASKILDALDTTVNPCDDFYDFSCGTYIKTANIPDAMSAVSVFSEVEDLIDEQLRTIMEEQEILDEIKVFALVKKFFKSCMDTNAIENISIKDMNESLIQFGGWPVVEENTWKEEDFDWMRMIHKFKREGFKSQFFITLYIDADSKNNSRNIISIDEAELGIDREFLIKGQDDKLVKGYFNYMVDVAVIFGANRARAERELKESLQFEIGLANIKLPHEEQQNPWNFYNIMSIEELQNKCKSIRWLEYVNGYLAPYTNVTYKEIICVNVPKYIANFEKLISETPKRVIANYLIWRLMDSSMDYLTDELRKRRLQYLTLSSGITSEGPRWKECVNIVNQRLDSAVGALYARKYISLKTKRDVEDLFVNIQNELKEILTKSEWMDDNTKRRGIEKLAGMKKYVCYPDELSNDSKLEEYYRTLEIDSGRFLKSSLNITLFNYRHEILKLRLPTSETNWVSKSQIAVANAFYLPSENDILIPGGILQGVFFHEDRPKYVNYGGIGHVIGHELTHGFDNTGRRYDKDGNLKNWWANDTENKFNKKASCIMSQYNDYNVTEIEMHINGNNTLGENIADIGGIKEAYRAYEKYIEKNGKEQILPGLNYTGRQLFWISTSLKWCSKTRVETLKEQVITNEHAPEKFRVWGPVSNMPEFAKDFNCKMDTKMNPRRKCQLW